MNQLRVESDDLIVKVIPDAVLTKPAMQFQNCIIGAGFRLGVWPAVAGSTRIFVYCAERKFNTIQDPIRSALR